MLILVLQSALMLAIAFILGCFVGWLLRGLFARAEIAPETIQYAAETPPSVNVSAPIVTASAVIPEPETTASQPPDNLKLIRGIGPQNEKRLNDKGINSFAQIAAWGAEDQEKWGEILSFPGRIEREEWVAQAKALAAGEATQFSKRVKRGEVASSLSANKKD